MEDFELIETFTNTSTGRTGSIQTWTAPSDGLYRIAAFGAEGGGQNSGKGAKIVSEFELSAGEELEILVGQKGERSSSTDLTTGGGGTFVTKNGVYNNGSSSSSESDIYVIAGGGGGADSNQEQDGNTGEDGSRGYGGYDWGSGGSNGGGGDGSGGYGGGPGGGGIWGDGASDEGDDYGVAYVNGGYGGQDGVRDSDVVGGFGGGASARPNDEYVGGGGAGGYSGGGGGGGDSYTDESGGGGGSYYNGNLIEASGGERSGHGLVEIYAEESGEVSVSEPAIATATPTAGAADSVSNAALAPTTTEEASNYASATSTSLTADAEAETMVSSTQIIEAPKTKLRKPRARVEITKSGTGETFTVIDSDDGSTNYLIGDLKIEGSVKSAVDGVDFTLSNPGNRFEFLTQNDEIEVYLGYHDPMIRVMRGLVTKVETSYGTDGNTVRVEGEDFGQLLQQRVAAEVYLDEEVGFIVEDLVEKYAPELDTSAVKYPGRVLESKRVAYDTLFDVIEDLAEKVDFQFYVDNDKNLHFEPEGFEDSNHVFREKEIVKEFSKTPNLKKLVNEAIVFGGKRDVREEQFFDGDGSTTTFLTTYKPHDPDVFVDGEHLQGGAKGTTELGEVGYVYDVDTREFEFANPPSSGTENIEIRYSRHIPIQAISEDQDSKQTYGRHQKRITDENITRRAEAKTIADSLVENYAEPPVEVSATVLGVRNLKAGQTVTFDMPSVGVEEDELDVVNITYRWGSSGYTVDLGLNEEPADLTKVIKELKQGLSKTKGFDSGILDLIRKIQSYADSLSISEILNVDNRPINDSFVLGHPDNGVLGEDKLGDRRGNWADLIDQ